MAALPEEGQDGFDLLVGVPHSSFGIRHSSAVDLGQVAPHGAALAQFARRRRGPLGVPSGTTDNSPAQPTDSCVFSVVVARATERRSADFRPQERW